MLTEHLANSFVTLRISMPVPQRPQSLRFIWVPMVRVPLRGSGLARRDANVATKPLARPAGSVATVAALRDRRASRAGAARVRRQAATAAATAAVGVVLQVYIMV
ncbi:hypothetical protein FGB62_71g228 [Gracilaria domingensis]|nr:hypothetical protein FGB62_71g228 [Gracilaria domingensis]